MSQPDNPDALTRKVRELEDENRTLKDEVTRLRAENRRWARMAGTEALTGLPNKVSFVRALLPQALERAAKERKPIGVVLLSADNLGQVNEQFGREAGDEVLKGLGQLLRSVLPDSDRLAHLDGANFAVVLYPAHLEAAKGRANMLRARVRAHGFPFDDSTAQISVSAGVLSADVPVGADIREVTESLLSFLNKSLYTAKKAGGNRVETSPNNPYESKETVS